MIYIVQRFYDEDYSDIVFVTTDQEKATSVATVAQTIFPEDYFTVFSFDDGEITGLYEDMLKDVIDD
jgi:hypothetical protein